MVQSTEKSDDRRRAGNQRFPARLRVDVFDERMSRRGIITVAAQARDLDLDRSYLFDLRAGSFTPTVGLALHMARRARVSVERLFEPVETAEPGEAA